MHADIFHTIIRYPLSILLLISSVATERRHFSTESKAQYTFNQCSVNVDSSHYVPSFPVYYQTGPGVGTRTSKYSYSFSLHSWLSLLSSVDDSFQDTINLLLA